MHDPSSEKSKRVLQARMAAHALHARVADPSAHTAAARKAFLSRFEREVDQEGVLEPQDRARRAEHAKKAYFTRLALASSKARAEKQRK
jgi:anti-sigma factor RsiW